MAEKEERIAVAKMLVNTDDEGSAKLDHFKIYSRQEAIERMAKALFKVDNVLAFDIEFEQLIKQKQSTYKVFAAAALNALLGE